jgi:hypothetical protein
MKVLTELPSARPDVPAPTPISIVVCVKHELAAVSADELTLLKQVSDLEKQVAELEARETEVQKFYNLRVGLPPLTAIQVCKARRLFIA